MQSRVRRAGPKSASIPAAAEDEETTLLGRLESVSKDPETHGSAVARTGSLNTRRGRPLLSRAGTVCAALGLFVLGYTAGFCIFWAQHTQSPSAWALSLSLTEIESNPALGADFRSACASRTGVCKPFFFGLATAPAHVEDRLNDSWLEFAQETDEWGKRRVVAWANEAVPDQRLRFWSNPEEEVDLAAESGVSVLRLGVDWGRIVPALPPLASMGNSATVSVVDWAVVERYKQILALVKERGMSVMLTLFHHSFPKWGLPLGGWTNPDAIILFTQFAMVVSEHLGSHVHFWVTFNEPVIFVMATHCWCIWPPAPKGSCPLPGWEGQLCSTPWGVSRRAMRIIAAAHNAAYVEIRKRSSAPIGVAHSVAVQTPYSAFPLDVSAGLSWDRAFLFPWIDDVAAKLDFCGLNYYGQEFASSLGLHMVEGEEYSEAGRAVYPDGLFKLLMAFHARYRGRYPSMRYIITENGIADADDTVRRAYLLEHLAALHAAIAEGVPVDGYIHWTISDNWEWADGYCPKFGLVDVNRSDNLTRTPRPSYHLYKQIVQSRMVTGQQRQQAWQELQALVQKGATRPVCRYPLPNSLMAPESLDSPMRRNVSSKEWRFGRYQYASIWTMFLRSLTVMRARLNL